jgi:hypothetical protein
VAQGLERSAQTVLNHRPVNGKIKHIEYHSCYESAKKHTYLVNLSHG